jgi:hypothetical protein
MLPMESFSILTPIISSFKILFTSMLESVYL